MVLVAAAARTYDPNSGILTVTVDMGFDEFKVHPVGQVWRSSVNRIWLP